MKEHKAKQLLNKKANFFSKSYKELFGETFCEDYCSNLKTKQKYQEVLRNKTKSSSTKVLHSLTRNLVDTKVQHAPLAGRLMLHLKNWEELTQDENILTMSQGFKIPFSRAQFQYTLPQATRVNQQ